MNEAVIGKRISGKKYRKKGISFLLEKRYQEKSIRKKGIRKKVSVFISILLFCIHEEQTSKLILMNQKCVFYKKYYTQRLSPSYHFLLPQNNLCFPCNITITNFLIVYTCEIRFCDVIYRTVHMFTS